MIIRDIGKLYVRTYIYITTYVYVLGTMQHITRSLDNVMQHLLTGFIRNTYCIYLQYIHGVFDEAGEGQNL